MAKEYANKTLLDCWTPPQITSDTNQHSNPVPIAFISTSFTFDADFFDEECLTRFLTMETEKENDGAAFLIEREEKLASLHGGIVLVDQNHCKGSRSLRWDLVPCRVRNGIMHAKITILHWSNCIRLIIGSANLTESGYCINQEIYSCFDYYTESDVDLKIITDILAYLQDLITDQCGDTVRARFSKLQSEIKSTLKKWRIAEKKYKKDEVSVDTLLVSPRQKNALIKLREIWGSNFSKPPDSAFVTSPFFDNEESASTPSLKIFEILQQRGPVEIVYKITAEPLSEESNQMVANAPEFLKKTFKTSREVSFDQIIEVGKNENGKNVPRPLHLKSIWLSKDDMHLFQIGSSNFTSAALGLGKRTNYEANLVFCVSSSWDKKEYDLILASNPESFPLETEQLVFRQRANEDEEPVQNEYMELPLFFKEAVILKAGDQMILQLNLNSAAGFLPSRFRIWTENISNKKDSSKCIFNESRWNLHKITVITINWNDPVIPDYLLVDWDGADRKAFWPVVVESQITLPPVEGLRNLPLEALLQILSSSQPLHRLIGLIDRIRKSGTKIITEDAVVDVHQLVNTSGFLLQRTRRISYAMKALRNRLEKPVFTKESLNWRLYGPIGVHALQEAILNEAKSEEEKRFLLAELALELSRVKPLQTDISLKQEEVKSGIREILENLANTIKTEPGSFLNPVEDYSLKALQKAIYEL